jgi:hypothetical protein
MRAHQNDQVQRNSLFTSTAHLYSNPAILLSLVVFQDYLITIYSPTPFAFVPYRDSISRPISILRTASKDVGSLPLLRVLEPASLSASPLSYIPGFSSRLPVRQLASTHLVLNIAYCPTPGHNVTRGQNRTDNCPWQIYSIDNPSPSRIYIPRSPIVALVNRPVSSIICVYGCPALSLRPRRENTPPSCDCPTEHWPTTLRALMIEESY